MSVEVIRDDEPGRERADWELLFDALCELDALLAEVATGRETMPAGAVIDAVLDVRQAVRHLLDKAFQEEESREIYR